MSSLRLVSWNVLHRYHEEKHAPHSIVSPNLYLLQNPDEKVRLLGQIEVIRGLIVAHSENPIIICLQEVPGDLLSLLEINFSPEFEIVSHQHNRVPSAVPAIRPENIYTNAKEYLCTLIPRKFYPTITSHFEQYKTSGKGALICIVDGLCIVNTHATIKQEGIDNVYQVYAKYYDPPMDMFILGDFNNSLTDILNTFRNDMPNCIFSDGGLSIHSYPRGNRSIDQILGWSRKSGDIVNTIMDVGYLSDHFPTMITINFS